MIKITDIKKSYKDVNALKGINLTIEENKITLLLGPNGAGKTTLIKIILGILFPDSGTVVFKREARIGYMQEGQVGKPDWTVERYLRFIGELCEIDRKLLSKKLEVLFDRYELKEKRNASITSLSSGQKQRVKWIQSIIVEPDVLVLDEPTSGLDPIGKIEMRKHIMQEKEKGKTVLVSSHLLDEVEKYGDNYLILVDGRIIDRGNVKSVSEKDLETYFYQIVSDSKGVRDENDI